ncbi:MAG: endonuclease/exonuclease/phosphatase family protein [Candidatus Eremiobacteraeota bacterium]|nr:endonuclease/exonuclease/phosphatase family protein [Candidatus Eremiobacteraeota bacterium]
MSVITKNRESRVVRKGAPKKKPETTGTTKAEAKGDKTSISRESRTEKSEKSDGRVGNITKGLASYVSGTSSAKGKSDSKESVGVSTYNLGAGNKDASKKENFEKTSDLLAEEVVNGDTDVALLQEVGVDGKRTQDRDNNQEILEDIFVKELGDEWEDSDISRQSLDEQGNPVKGEDGKPVYDPEKYADTQVTATREDGQSEDLTVTRERYDDSGDPVDWKDGPEKGAVVVYEADMGEGKDYKVVFGSSNKHGSYGNSVLLGPGYEVKDVQREILGQDPPEEGDNGNPENRTALGVTFETPGGEEVSAISAHLTNGQAEDRGEARNDQYRALDDFAESLEGRGPVLLGGDFNSKAGGEYAKEFFDFLPFVDPPKHPGADELGWNDPNSGSNSIDRIYTLGEAEVGEREIFEDQGGSDHDLIHWDVAV